VPLWRRTIKKKAIDSAILDASHMLVTLRAWKADPKGMKFPTNPKYIRESRAKIIAVCAMRVIEAIDSELPKEDRFPAAKGFKQ
jgi:hypothetical protein